MSINQLCAALTKCTIGCAKCREKCRNKYPSLLCCVPSPLSFRPLRLFLQTSCTTFTYNSNHQAKPRISFFGLLLLRGKVHSLTPQIHCGLPAAALLPFFLSGSAPLTLHSFTPFPLNTPYSYRAKFPLTRLSLLPTPALRSNDSFLIIFTQCFVLRSTSFASSFHLAFTFSFFPYTHTSFFSLLTYFPFFFY